MTVSEILQYCQEKGVTLIPKPNGRLGYRGLEQAITNDFLSELKAHKLVLLQVLQVMSAFEGEIINCQNTRCGASCSWEDPSQCPWNLPEGRYKWRQHKWVH